MGSAAHLNATTRSRASSYLRHYHVAIFVLLTLIGRCAAYLDFGPPIEYYPMYNPRTLPEDHPAADIPIGLPRHAPQDWHDVRRRQNEVLPSMITAIAPSVTMLSNGSHQTMFSIQYHEYFVKKRQGMGLFNKRGVFANDPPIPTCTPCGTVGYSTIYGNATTLTQTCSTASYDGVFRSGVGSAVKPSQICYASSYSGVLGVTTVSSGGLPCCFSSCQPNSTTSSGSPSYTFTTGVFATTYTSNMTSLVTTTTTSASPSSSVTVTTVSLTSIVISSTTSIVTLISSSTVISCTTPIVTVISSSTVTISAIDTDVGGPRPGSTTTSSDTQVTLTVITAPPRGSQSPYTITMPNTVEGCGTASGSGTIIGTGTVFYGPFGIVPIVSSGTAIGMAGSVVGCGTLIATSGSFSGSATIIACGAGYGSATVIGSGTVYPAALGGLIGFTSSGTVEGRGSVVGCGTIIGSGTFTATAPYTTTITPHPNQTTVSVIISSCPLPMIDGMPRLAGNASNPYPGYGPEDDPNDINPDQTPSIQPPSDASPTPGAVAPAGNRIFYPSFTSTSPYANTSFPQSQPNPNPNTNTTTSSTNLTALTPSNSKYTTPDPSVCRICPNDAGICCHNSVTCTDAGHCPWQVMINSGYVVGGLNVVYARNSSRLMTGF